MTKKFNISLIISLILGIILGYYFPSIANKLSFIGTIYINLLKFMIIPILITSITVTIYNSIKTKNKILPRTLITFLIMFISSFLITSLLVILIEPSKNIEIVNTLKDVETTNISISQIITNLFPSNIITMLEENSTFQIILFSVIFGICTSKVESGNKIIKVFDSLKDIFSKLLEYIMYLTPIGVLFLIGNIVSTYGTGIIKNGISYIATAYLCSIIVLILVMILPVAIITKTNVLKYIKKLSKVWLITMTTCSSSATLPYTIKVCNEELNIKEEVTNIVVPLGCTIHMCGGAVSFALLGLFSTSLFNIHVDILTYLLMLTSATLINMAAPGIPSGGVVIGATYLSILNIPLSFIGPYTAIYKILDMVYTTLNVTGDISANMIINHINNKENKK